MEEPREQGRNGRRNKKPFYVCDFCFCSVKDALLHTKYHKMKNKIVYKNKKKKASKRLSGEAASTEIYIIYIYISL